MTRIWIVLRTLALAGLIICCSAAGVFKPLDNFLQTFRFSALQRQPTGEIAFVEIDAASLKSVGVWPWPRTVHAELVDRLMALGAGLVVFDVDFSAASTPQNDAAFAAALDRAGGYVALAAFEQGAGLADSRVANVPIASLSAASSIVSVDVPLDADGVVRDYPYSLRIADHQIPSVANALWRPPLRGASLADGGFGIDFGIDADAIDRISVADLLANKVDAARVKGRDIVIGSSAEELRDFFLVPRFGTITGALVHILAAETLKQGLAMRDAPFWVGCLAILLLACLAAAFDHRLSRAGPLLCAVAISIATELCALWLQHAVALRIETASVQSALAVFMIVAMLSDLALRRRLHAEAERQRDETRMTLDQVVADNFDGVIIVDSAMRIVKASRLAGDLLGCDLAQQRAASALPKALEQALSKALAGNAAHRTREVAIGEAVIYPNGGAERTIEFVATASSLDGGDQRRVACLTFRDITERRAQESRLNYLARNDPLTGAWTRHEFVQQIQASATSNSGLALILIDLRRFNVVNEIFGHAIGDHVLKAVAERLRADGFMMIARLGGDSFAVAVPDGPDGAAVADICRRLIRRLREPYTIDGHRIVIGVSLGATTSTLSGADAGTLLNHANIAEALAKKQSGNNYEVYSPVMEVAVREKQWMESALRQAIAEGELSLAYQPQFDLASGALIGAEALMRWRHRDIGAISPAIFIPLAEETGLIGELGRWALRTACRAAARWPSHLCVAVNVSPVQFEAADMATEVAGVLEQEGLAPRQLELEITEGVFVAGATEIPATLTRLRAQGIAIALDDFGTGYSSLSYLGRMPIDRIKIDQSFVRGLAEGAEAEAVIQAIITLSHKLGKVVIAEGIETAEQKRQLLRMGCGSGQGFYLARPMPVEEFLALIAREAKAPAIANSR